MSTGLGDIELGEREVHVWVLPLEHPEKTRRRELAHRAERQILAHYLEVDEAAVVFDRNAYGKPHLPGDLLHFNLSHSGAWAMLAVSRELELGIDLQGPHRTATRAWFAERICTPRERAALGPAPEPAELLRLWARKEAVIKARGDLAYVSAGEVDVLEDVIEGGWQCVDLAPPERLEDHHAALAVQGGAAWSLQFRGAWPVAGATGD